MQQNKKIYISAFWETLIILILTVLPTIFGYFSIVFDKDSSKVFSDFYKSGEFFLYGVSFSGSAFLVYHSTKEKRGLFPLVIILLSSIAYTVSLNVKTPNLEVIKYCSISSIIISILIFYFAQVLSNKNSNPIDVRDYRNDEQNTIQQGLN
ncbi:hypothetical protein [Flavobacterium sp. N502540]|uniref:hypothetical protein n=1 Tax=Flavobacterium sp. N502540 TaxID=2986838 RepID=UPI0022250120|nr:hypothetical protein [Flavobacterium sp. N502540]